MPQHGSSQDERNAATYIALTGLFIVSAAIVGLAAMVIPAIGYIVLVLAGMMGIGALQYTLWGWRLDRDRVVDDDESTRSQS